MTEDGSRRAAEFRRRALFASAALLGLWCLLSGAWILRTLLLMVFLAVLVGVLLRSLGNLLSRATGLKASWAVLVVAATFALAALAASFFVAPLLAGQIRDLVAGVPGAIDAVQRRLGNQPWLTEVWDQFGSGLSLPSPGAAVSGAAGLLGSLATAFGYLGLVLISGIYLATDPGLYRRGLVRLLPVRHRAEAETLLDDLEGTILSWLGGQLVLMGFVGAMVGLGLWALGVPYPLALGLLAGALEFIPYLGPILSAVPAILIAFGVDPWLALWVLLLFVGVQQVENNVLQPLIQKSAADVPPVLLIVALLAMGQLFGVPGLLVAAPLTAVLLVIVRRVYVEGILEGGGPDPTGDGRGADGQA